MTSIIAPFASSRNRPALVALSGERLHIAPATADFAAEFAQLLTGH